MLITGCYAINSTVGNDFAKMYADATRQGNLPRIENFFGERFANLSLYAHQSNAQLAAEKGAPSWAGASFFKSPNAQVFASNLVVTFDEFVNAPHIDLDATKYAFGIFGRIYRDTGNFYFCGDDKTQGKIVGAGFLLVNYNTLLDYDACDGVIEQVWNTKILHMTTPSRTFNSKGRRISPNKSPITRFGSACQISQALVDRIEKVKALRADFDDAAWEKFQGTVLTGYAEEMHKKMKKLAERRGIDPSI